MIIEILIIVGSSASVITVAGLIFAHKIIKGENSFDDLKRVVGKAELHTCPFCGIANGTKGTFLPVGNWIKEHYIEKGKKDKVANVDWGKDIVSGPSSGVVVPTAHGSRLWQICTRCLGEWIVVSKGD